ncbi:MAG: glycosyltransferase [Elusimicrobiales bacterium]|nr:glycosyltransferase [Elusimicrobiales bacterium]
MKKILLANFAECPENLHFERAFIRALAGRKVSLDIVHDFDFDYKFIGAQTPPGGRRLKYSGLAALKRETAGKYDLLVLLDFPKRARCAPAFLWLAREAHAAKKIYIANHLIPMPGHNFTADLARRYKALAGLTAGYMLEFDDWELWGAMGLEGERLLRRGYATDCGYYKPLPGPAGAYVFSAGSAGREFDALAAGVKNTGLGLKIFSDAKPAKLPRGAQFLPLAKNLHNLKAAAAGARAVVIPVKDGHINEAAGNSIAFLAMALGRPVLTKKTPYMERVIKDGVNGFFYNSLTPLNLARGLNRILALTPAKQKKLAAAARKTILQKASLDRFCKEFVRKFARG